jgi:hypothetical protein
MPRSPLRVPCRRLAAVAGGAAIAVATLLHAAPQETPVWQPPPERNACYGISVEIGELLPGAPFPFAVVGSYLRNFPGSPPIPAVDNAGAIFVLRWGGPDFGWLPEATLFPPVPASNTYFGRSVAALQAPGRGDFAFAGAYRDSVPGPERGAVQIYSSPPGKEWSAAGTLRPGLDGVDGEWFGFSLDAGHVDAANIDNLIVGAPRARPSGSSTTNGAAYMFERRFGGWARIRKFGGAGVGAATNQFGWSVALLPNIVTVPGEAATAPRKLVAIGSPGNAVDRGQVHVFEAAAGSSWNTATERIRRVGGLAPGDRYGEVVAVAKRFMAVAAPGRSENRGAVYIWERTGVNAMLPVQALQPKTLLPGDRFGNSLSMAEQADGSVVLAVGVRGDDTFGEAAGSVRLYRWSPGTPGSAWQAIGAAFAPGDADGDQFGFSVAVGSPPGGSGQVLVGSPFRNFSPILFNSGGLDAVTPP